MSDEESSDEDDDFIKRAIPWRSEDVNRLIAKIDGVAVPRARHTKRRKIGAPSSRLPKDIDPRLLRMVEE